MTRFSTNMATTVVPLLARLVLCAAFLTIGWSKLINDHTFRGEEARILLELGVVEQPVSGGAVGQPAAFTQFLGHWRPDEDDAADEVPGEAAEDEPPNDIDNAQDPQRDDLADVVEDVIEEVEETVEDAIDAVMPARRGSVARDPETGELIATAQALHTVTVIVHLYDGPNPVLMGWLTALTELIGGALLLIGLFTRLWGIALATVMAVAFYMTSWPVVADAGVFVIAADVDGGFTDFNRVYVQLALFVLAFGVFLTGAGPISLDRWLFRPAAEPTIEYDEE